MAKRISLAFACLVAWTSLRAADAQPLGGKSGVRALLGVSAFLDIGDPTPLTGNKLIFGGEFLFGKNSGLFFAGGLRMGFGQQSVLLEPYGEVRYGFDLDSAFAPWIGGGVGVRTSFGSPSGFNLGLLGRFAAGVDYTFSSWAAIGAQLVMPDLGARLTPSTTPIGTVEWTIGPHFRL